MADESNITTQAGTDPAQTPEVNPSQAQEGESSKKGEAKYSDADVDRILSQKFAKWQEAQDKKISEAQKLAEMNAQQKAEYERDKLQQELADYKKRDAKASMMSESRSKLSSAGINASDAILSALINTEDAEATQRAVDDFATMYAEAVKAGIAEALKGQTPRAGGSTQLTKADIMAIKDRTERQRLINEHLDLFQ